MHVDDRLMPWLDPLRDALGELAPLDCHTHIGERDPDGYTSERDDLIDSLRRAEARGIVFPMHEPGGYREPNDRMRAAAEASEGRLVAFCRVDPRAGASAEAERSLDAGARGVKLHPRAEEFSLADPEIDRLAALAAERRVPILTHAGRGIPALGRDALALLDRHDGLALILAHAGISDLSWIWRHAADRPGLLFDTAWWGPVDLLALFALVPPGNIVYGSDAPYGTPVQGMTLTLRCALQAGLSSEQTRSVLGAQAERLIAGQPPLEHGGAPGQRVVPEDILLERVYTLLAAAVRRYLHGQDAAEEIALARLACDVGDDAPQAPVCDSILALLDIAAEHERDRSGAESQHPAAHLLVTAAAVARTPDVALPEPATATAGAGGR